MIEFLLLRFDWLSSCFRKFVSFQPKSKASEKSILFWIKSIWSVFGKMIKREIFRSANLEYEEFKEIKKCRLVVFFYFPWFSLFLFISSWFFWFISKLVLEWTAKSFLVDFGIFINKNLTHKTYHDFIFCYLSEIVQNQRQMLPNIKAKHKEIL